MRLYYAPGACSLAPHIVIREAGLEVELDKLDFATRKTASGVDFASINAKGYVPALQIDDGSVLTECSALVQYLADQRPDTRLAPPAGTIERTRLQEWLGFIATELHKGFSPLWSQATPDSYKTVVKENLAKRFDHLNRHLASNLYLMGAQFTAADAYAFTIVNWANFHQIDLGRWPNLQAYMGRVAARPKVQEALKAEGLLK